MKNIEKSTSIPLLSGTATFQYLSNNLHCVETSPSQQGGEIEDHFNWVYMIFFSDQFLARKGFSWNYSLFSEIIFRYKSLFKVEESSSLISNFYYFVINQILGYKKHVHLYIVWDVWTTTMMTAHPFEIVYLGQKHVYEPSVSYWAGFLSLVLQTYTLHSLLEYISEQKKQEYCSFIHYEFAMH